MKANKVQCVLEGTLVVTVNQSMTYYGYWTANQNREW